MSPLASIYLSGPAAERLLQCPEQKIVDMRRGFAPAGHVVVRPTEYPIFIRLRGA
jgi:hypothetical protein